MYPEWVGPAAAGFLTLWLGVLTFLVWQQGKFLKSLFPRFSERDIRKKFEEVIGAVEKFNISLAELESKVAGVQNQGLKHIQRVYLSRYNPYDETGGNISFSVVLLDNEGTGIVVTSLHSRSGTRIFAKPVIKGKSGKYNFSREEEFVIKKALNE